MKKSLLFISSIFILSNVSVLAAEDNSARILEIESQIKELETELKELKGTDSTNEENSSNKEVIQPGKYKIGTNLEPGEYVITAIDDRGYFAILADSNGDDILTNENFDEMAYVTVKDGEYLDLSRSTMVKFDPTLPNTNKKEIFEGGVYLVGYDIEPGEYLVETSQNSNRGYWALLDGSGAERDIITNENFENQSFVTLTDGQYLELSRAVIDLSHQ